MSVPVRKLNGCRKLGVTAEGRPAGEWHHGAKLSDADIDLIRELHEPKYNPATGQWEPGLGYRALSRKFETPKRTIRDIIHCRRRYAIVIKFKTLRADPDQAHEWRPKKP